MAVTIDATGTAQGNSSAVTSINYTGLTIGAGLTNSAVVISVALNGSPSGFSATWAGTSMTQLASASNGAAGTVLLFGLKNPTSGNQTAAISWTGGSAVEVCGTSWSGVDQTTPFQNATTLNSQPAAASGSITINSAVNDAVVAAFVDGNSGNSADHTQIYADNTITGSCSNRAAGASPSVTLGFTQGSAFSWGAVGIDITAASLTLGQAVVLMM